METTEEGQGDDSAVRMWLDRARLGRILLEGELSERPEVMDAAAAAHGASPRKAPVVVP